MASCGCVHVIELRMQCRCWCVMNWTCFGWSWPDRRGYTCKRRHKLDRRFQLRGCTCSINGRWQPVKTDWLWGPIHVQNDSYIVGRPCVSPRLRQIHVLHLVNIECVSEYFENIVSILEVLFLDFKQFLKYFIPNILTACITLYIKMLTSVFQGEPYSGTLIS